jgi:hypothetical protein
MTGKRQLIHMQGSHKPGISNFEMTWSGREFFCSSDVFFLCELKSSFMYTLEQCMRAH